MLKLRKLDDAEKLIRRNIKTNAGKYGPEHEKTVDSKYYLATLLRFQKKLKSAQEVDKEVIAWRTKHLGPSH